MVRTENTSIDDFLAADERTTVVSLIPLLLQGGQSGRELLSQVADFRRLIFENQNDIDYLRNSYLVWYKPNGRGESEWNKAGCKNYTVAEYVDSMLQGSISREDLMKLVLSLKGGLKEKVMLVIAFDTTVNKRVIVDGCKRALALALIARQDEKELSNLLNSKFSIVVMELRSALTHCLYPCDLLNLMVQAGESSSRERRQ